MQKSPSTWKRYGKSQKREREREREREKRGRRVKKERKGEGKGYIIGGREEVAKAAVGLVIARGVCICKAKVRTTTRDGEEMRGDEE